VQIFGGLGVVKGTTVERLFRHCGARFRIFDGTSEIQQLIIARICSLHDEHRCGALFLRLGG